MLLLDNISELLTLQGAAAKRGRRVLEGDLSILKKQSILVDQGRILWMGPRSRLPKSYAKKKIKVHDLKGFTVLPGFVECHTHTLFAGSRAHEFELRNQGVSYQEIAARGGGILSTMRQTRQASLASLVRSGQERVDRFVRQGVTSLEIKSGYALDLTGEIKMLRAASLLRGPRIIPTFLGAHDLPPEFSDHGQYLNFLLQKLLPLIKKKKLARRVDIFIEKGFFGRAEAESYLRQARELGFDLVVHADQLSLSGGADTAMQVGALSADHLLRVTPTEIQKLADSEVVSVLLPASDLYMKKNYPPARALIDAGACVALATDFNPGSSPTQDLTLTGLLARLEMKMSLAEVIAAYTWGGARALGLESECGSIELGKSADFMCTSKSWTDLFYTVGDSEADFVFAAGNLVHHKI